MDKSRANFLKCVLLNARSIMSKLSQWHHFLYSGEHDVILVTESWLKDTIPTSLVDPEQAYNVLRCDRKGRGGGGVCVLVAKDIQCVEVSIPEQFSTVEMCCVDIFYHGKTCRILNVYRPPDEGQDAVKYMSELLSCIVALNHSTCPTIITGDFNCRNIDWANINSPYDGIQDALLKLSIFEGFEQVVSTPTRGDNILDLVFTNEPLAICNVNVGPPLGNSDHCKVSFNVFFDSAHELSQINSCNTVRDWKQADFAGISQYLLDIDWLYMLSVNLTTESLWSAFSDVLNNAINIFVPIKCNAKPKHNIKYYPNSIKHAFARKLCLWRRHRADRHNNNILQAYKLSEMRCKQLVQKYETKKERHVISDNNVGAFYKFVNKKLTCKSGIGALYNQSGDLITSDKDRAGVLNEYFTSVCTKDNGLTCPMSSKVQENTFIDNITFSPTAVMNAIKKLKPNNASGPDGFPPLLFKKLSTSLAEPLSLLFTSFFSMGQVPQEWLRAIVTPVYKSGLASNVKNYRPISLTSVACKVMERIIVCEMLCYLRSNNLISKQQHGFLSRRSTTTNLLETLNDWTLAIDNKNALSAVYIDFARAFDTVCRSKLCYKLSCYGIAGNLLKWIQSFLTDRSQCTRVGHSSSDYASLSSGIVQGSILGPLLFLLYINDIVDLFDSTCSCKLYADDIKIYSVINTREDCESMQSILNDIQAWSDQWQLSIAYKKCSTMFIGNRNNDVTFTLGSEDLTAVKQVKDLGVNIKNDCNFNCHVDQITARAHARANLIHKCFVSKDTNTLVKAFTTYVRPLLEYASCVWSPCSIVNIKKVESVQRRFTKRLPNMATLDYATRLSAVNLDSLQVRRLRTDLLYVYKLLFNLVDTDFNAFFKLSDNATNTRGHNYKLFVCRSRLNIRQHFFSNRIVNVWNSLPAKLEHFATLSSFTNFVKQLDLNKSLFL
jgi:hypothetical protein